MTIPNIAKVCDPANMLLSTTGVNPMAINAVDYPIAVTTYTDGATTITSKCADGCSACNSAYVCTSCRVGYSLHPETEKCV